LVRADALLAALKQYAPDILNATQEAVAKQTEDGDFLHLESNAFEACRSESIDYAVLEQHNNVAMVPFQGAWSDVGSWNAVADLAQGKLPQATEHRHAARPWGMAFTPATAFCLTTSRPLAARPL
jgi:mannose-1-phosphate guanylyltransferase / mannose-6-phosphate isomerase